MIAELIYKLLHARTNAHILHLATRSYAAHAALKEFYDTVTDFADSIAEGYQGEYGLIDFSGKQAYRFDADAQHMITELRKWIEENRYQVVDPDDTYIQNTLDEVLMLCSTTSYKLKFLR